MPLFLVAWQHVDDVTLVRANNAKHLGKIVTGLGFDPDALVFTEYVGPLFLNLTQSTRTRLIPEWTAGSGRPEAALDSGVFRASGPDSTGATPEKTRADMREATPGTDGGKLALSLRSRIEKTRSAQADELSMRLRAMQVRMEMDVSAKAMHLRRRTAAKQLLLDAREEQKILDKQREKRATGVSVATSDVPKAPAAGPADDEEADIRRTFEELRSERARLQAQLFEKQRVVQEHKDRQTALERMHGGDQHDDLLRPLTRESLQSTAVPLKWTPGSSGKPAPEDRAAYYETRRSQILDQVRAIDAAEAAVSAAERNGSPSKFPMVPPNESAADQRGAWEAALRSLPSETQRLAAESADAKALADRSANELIAWAEAKRAEAAILRETRNRDAETRKAFMQSQREELEGRRVAAQRRRKLVVARREQALLEEEVRSYMEKVGEREAEDAPMPRTLQEQRIIDNQAHVSHYKTPRTANAELMLSASHEAASASLTWENNVEEAARADYAHADGILEGMQKEAEANVADAMLNSVVHDVTDAGEAAEAEAAPVAEPTAAAADPAINEVLEEAAATKIQAIHRGKAARAEVARLKSEAAADGQLLDPELEAALLDGVGDV